MVPSSGWAVRAGGGCRRALPERDAWRSAARSTSETCQLAERPPWVGVQVATTGALDARALTSRPARLLRYVRPPGLAAKSSLNRRAGPSCRACTLSSRAMSGQHSDHVALAAGNRLRASEDRVNPRSGVVQAVPGAQCLSVTTWRAEGCWRTRRAVAHGQRQCRRTRRSGYLAVLDGLRVSASRPRRTAACPAALGEAPCSA